MSVIEKISKVYDQYKPTFNLIKKIVSSTVLGALTLYAIGFFFGINTTTDDLISRDIKAQIPKEAIILETLSVDLHGYGNNSIVVAIGDKNHGYSENPTANEVFIFDAVDSDFLKYLYRPFKIGSSYILKHRIHLDKWNSARLEAIDLTGDKVKDLIIYTVSQGASNASIETRIISWQDGNYKLVGTFPPLHLSDPSEREDLTAYSSKVHQNQKEYFEKQMRGEEIKLNGFLQSFMPRFADLRNNGFYELIVYRPVYEKGEARSDKHYHRIDVFKPYLRNGALLWRITFSEYTPLKDNRQKYLDDFLQENYP